VAGTQVLVIDPEAAENSPVLAGDDGTCMDKLPTWLSIACAATAVIGWQYTEWRQRRRAVVEAAVGLGTRNGPAEDDDEPQPDDRGPNFLDADGTDWDNRPNEELAMSRHPVLRISRDWADRHLARLAEADSTTALLDPPECLVPVRPAFEKRLSSVQAKQAVTPQRTAHPKSRRRPDRFYISKSHIPGVMNL